MTISDLVQRLTKLYKDGNVNSSAQVKMKCNVAGWEQVFDYLEIKTVCGEVYLVPNEIWDRKEKVEHKPFYTGD